MNSARLTRRPASNEVEQRRLNDRSGQVTSLPSFHRPSRQRDRQYARDVVSQSVVEWLHESRKPIKQKRRSHGKSLNTSNKHQSTNRQVHFDSKLSLPSTRRPTTATRKKPDSHQEGHPAHVSDVTVQKNNLHKNHRSLVNIAQTLSPSAVIEKKQCSCQVTMTYRSDTTVPLDLDHVKRDEVTIYQELNNGFTSVIFKGFLKAGDMFSFKSQRSVNDPFQLIICINDLVDTYLSACCEYKYQDGIRIGGENGLFWLQNIEGAQPCRKCLEAIETSFVSHSRDSRKSSSSISTISNRPRLPPIHPTPSSEISMLYAAKNSTDLIVAAPVNQRKSTSLIKSVTDNEAIESKTFTLTQDTEVEIDEFRPTSAIPPSSVSIPVNKPSSSSSSSASASISRNSKWSRPKPVEQVPSINAILTKAPSLSPPTLVFGPPMLTRMIGDVENFCIAWIGESEEKDLILLRHIVNFIRVFDGIDALDTFLTDCKHSKVILLLPYAESQSIIHKTHTIPCIYSIYLLSTNQNKLSDWTKDYPKIVGIYKSTQSIHDHLVQTLPRISSSALISVITMTDAPFAYCQLLKETMLCPDEDSDLKQDMLEFCRLHYANNPDEMKNIDDFETEFLPRKTIWWYTRNCFLGKILSRALRTQEIDLLFKMRYFMQCLHTEIKSIAISKTTTVYARLEIPVETAMKLEENIKGLLLFNTYLPAMLEQSPLMHLNDNSKQISITFSINLGSDCGAMVKHLCAADTNIDVLINIDTIFRIHFVEKVSDKHWNVSLQSINPTDHQFKQSTDPLRTVIEAPVVLLQVCKLLLATDHYAECDYLAELLFTDQSLRGDPTLLASLAAVHHLLGNTDDQRDDARSALKQFFKSIRAFQAFLPSDHPLISASYNNIGSMYFKQNEYDEAIQFHQKALDCQLKAASPDTDAIATYSNNIGAVYFAQGKFSEALKYLHRAATILEKLSSAEKMMNLCFVYQKIAASYWRIDQGKEALEYYKKTLDIQLVSLPPTAHQISVTYFNLSTAYARIGQIDEAVRSAEKSVEQLLKIFPPDHPEVKENQAQLEIVRQKQWLQQVLSS